MNHDFQYVAPTTKTELLDFLAEHGESSAVFSGGTDLFVSIRDDLAKPDYVVDLKTVDELCRLTYTADGGLSIGAGVTVNELVDSADVQKHYPILHIAGDQLATFQLRNRATVAGNLVTASPCGDMSSPLLCLGARVVLTSKRGSRELAIQEFITGVKKTAIAPDEIMEKILVPAESAGMTGGYRKLKRIKGHDLGLIGVALTRKNGSFRVAISSAAPTPVLLPEFKAGTDYEDVKNAAMDAISPIDDVRCTAEYRSYMVGEYIKRLMEEVA
jgi:aerobic carbon-monoxide dehydrogenase medium subunit